MADAVVKLQRPEGYWSRSMMDEEHAPGYETSGTAFFTYGLLWGVNNGYLKDAKYIDAAKKDGITSHALPFRKTVQSAMCSR